MGQQATQLVYILTQKQGTDIFVCKIIAKILLYGLLGGSADLHLLDRQCAGDITCTLNSIRLLLLLTCLWLHF